MKFRLKELRKKRKISQLKLALDLNMSQNSISRYETGEREADYETLIKFADYFDVSVDFLCGSAHDKLDEEEVKRFLFGEDFIVSDDIWKEVKNYISFIKTRESK